MVSRSVTERRRREPTVHPLSSLDYEGVGVRYYVDAMQCSAMRVRQEKYYLLCQSASHVVAPVGCTGSVSDWVYTR